MRFLHKMATSNVPLNGHSRHYSGNANGHVQNICNTYCNLCNRLMLLYCMYMVQESYNCNVALHAVSYYSIISINYVTGLSMLYSARARAAMRHYMLHNFMLKSRQSSMRYCRPRDGSFCRSVWEMNLLKPIPLPESCTLSNCTANRCKLWCLSSSWFRRVTSNVPMNGHSRCSSFGPAFGTRYTDTESGDLWALA